MKTLIFVAAIGLAVVPSLAFADDQADWKICRENTELAYSLRLWKSFDGARKALIIDEYAWEEMTLTDKRTLASNFSCAIEPGYRSIFSIIGDQSDSKIGYWDGSQLSESRP